MLNPIPDTSIDSLFESTPWVDVQASTTVAPLTLTAPTLPPPTIPTIFQIHGSTNNEAVKVAVQIQSDRLRDEAQYINEEFLNIHDENIQKIIKEQVKEQVKVQVFKILPKIKRTVNEQLEAEVLTRSSNSSKTSYVVAADLSEMELKKIPIEKMESNNDGTLNDVRTTLDDRLKGIQMKYLPQAIWRRSNKERAAAMIQAIDKQLKMRRIMQSLEKFIGERIYEGDFRMLQQTM
nr:hypothetical protein [Tanacetum cinerariifolium]